MVGRLLRSFEAFGNRGTGKSLRICGCPRAHAGGGQHRTAAGRRGTAEAGLPALCGQARRWQTWVSDLRRPDPADF